ncbi:MAG: 4-hydroxy-tetrahydrodipicolinate reductase, partial [Saprospiraceae bacterium]
MKIALLGFGRMGQAIEKFALEKGHEIVLRINKENQEELNILNLSKADVAIDFSYPDSAEGHIRLCIDSGVPVVSGTTGWTKNIEEMNQYCEEKKGAFLYASNFSIGVNIFFVINEKLAEMMNHQNQYDVQMEEIHHIHKLDSPSGTGITLANQIIKNVDRKTAWIESETAQANEIAIHASRYKETPGTHGVTYTSAIDDIEIKHTAHSRDGFAKGALMAAE